MIDVRIGVVLFLLYFAIGAVVDILISGKKSDRNPTIIIFWPIFVLTMFFAVILMLPIAFIAAIRDKLKHDDE